MHQIIKNMDPDNKGQLMGRDIYNIICLDGLGVRLSCSTRNPVDLITGDLLEKCSSSTHALVISYILYYDINYFSD